MAKFPFEANGKYQLSLRAGDEVEVLEVSAGWYKGILLKTRQKGIFPANYIALSARVVLQPAAVKPSTGDTAAAVKPGIGDTVGGRHAC